MSAGQHALRPRGIACACVRVCVCVRVRVLLLTPVDDLVAIDDGVDLGLPLQRIRRCLDEDAHEAELDVVRLLKHVLVPGHRSKEKKGREGNEREGREGEKERGRRGRGRRGREGREGKEGRGLMRVSE